MRQSETIDAEQAKKIIVEYCLRKGALVVGVADLAAIERIAPPGHRPTDMMPRVRSVISIGVGGQTQGAWSVPAKAMLSPGEKMQIIEPGTLRFAETTGGAPVAIDGMTGFVNQVEFADGSVWVPGRAALNDPSLEKVLAPSAEEQRLTNLYRKKGLNALMDELKRFAH